MGTYFWGLTSAQLQWFSLTIIGAVVAFASLNVVGRRFDKRSVLLTSFALIVVFGMGVTSLRLLGLTQLQLVHLHDPEHNTFEAAIRPGGPVEVLQRCKDEGLIAHL